MSAPNPPFVTPSASPGAAHHKKIPPFGQPPPGPAASPGGLVWAQPLPFASETPANRKGVKTGGKGKQHRVGSLPTATPIGMSPGHLQLLGHVGSAPLAGFSDPCAMGASPPPALPTATGLSSGIVPGLPQARPAGPGSLGRRLPLGAPLPTATVLSGVSSSAPAGGMFRTPASSPPMASSLGLALAAGIEAGGAEEPRDRDRRHRARVSRVGQSPMLQIEGLGEFPFAYRAVKKKPGEPRTLLAVNDIVECRLTKSPPQKAVSVRILQGTNIPLSRATPEELGGQGCSGGSTQGLTPQPSPAHSAADDDSNAPPDLCVGEDSDDGEDMGREESDVIPLCGATTADEEADIPLCGGGGARQEPNLLWIDELVQDC
eukprot:Hpha_TRINITY_DN16383_c0_g8::TRINITY_DN16383_c0_g8_i1::g.58520::m.58520